MCFLAKNNRKLTFLYLANDVIQNSKKKGPEFTKDFESVLVDACSHVARYVLKGPQYVFSDGDNQCSVVLVGVISVCLLVFRQANWDY